MITFFAPLLLLQQATPATPASPPRCDTPEYSQFDFWVGEWDVYPSGSENKVADSKIEKLYYGCAIRENWMPLNKINGGSLNTYDPQTERWHQLWIGSSPGRVQFEGGLVDGSMVLTGYWGKDPQGNVSMTRMTYTLQEDGSVRQFGQSSSDHGVTWSTSFDFIYRPKAAREEKDTAE